MNYPKDVFEDVSFALSLDPLEQTLQERDHLPSLDLLIWDSEREI